MYKKTSDALQHAQEVDAPGRTGGYKRGTLSITPSPQDLNPLTIPEVYGGILEDKDRGKVYKGHYPIMTVIKPKEEAFTKLFSKQVIDLWDKNTQKHLISFRVNVPADYDLTQHNLFDFIEYLIFNFGRHSTEGRLTLHSDDHQWASISIQRAIGVRHFILEQKDKIFTFTVEGESSVFKQDTGWKIGHNQFVMYSKDESSQTGRILKLSPEGLHLYHQKAPVNYFIPYKEQLTSKNISEMSLFGTDRKLNPDMFIDKNLYKESYQDIQLVWKSIGSFTYLEAIDKSVFICFARQVSLYLLQAITALLRNHNDLKIDFLDRLQQVEIANNPKITEIHYVRTCLAFYNTIKHKI